MPRNFLDRNAGRGLHDFADLQGDRPIAAFARQSPYGQARRRRGNALEELDRIDASPSIGYGIQAETPILEHEDDQHGG